MISAEAELEVNEKLARLEKSESTQIAVLTVESLDGEPLEDFSIRVAEEDGRSLLPFIFVLLLIIYFYSQVLRGGGGHGSGPLIYTRGPGSGGFGRGGFSSGSGSFGGGGASGSW